MSRVCRNGVLVAGDATPGSFPAGAAFFETLALRAGVVECLDDHLARLRAVLDLAHAAEGLGVRPHQSDQFVEQYRDPMQIVLLVAGVICLFLPGQFAGTDHLQSDDAVQFRLSCLINHAHPAAGDLVQQFIVAKPLASCVGVLCRFRLRRR